MPAGQLGLAAGAAARLSAASRRYCPTTGPGHAWGVGIDQFHQAELDGLVVERGDRAEGQDFGPLRCRRGLGLLDGLEERSREPR